METFEDQKLKGITIKLIAWLVISSVTITGSVMGTYFSLLSHMDNNKVELKTQIDSETHQREMNDLQIREMRIRLDALEVKVEHMRTGEKPTIN